MPARNEERFIGRTLDALLGQDYPTDRWEVLVVDGQSTDATPDIVRGLQAGHPHLHIIDNERRWSSAGRNVAVARARGDILVVVDAHCDIPSRDYLRRLIRAFERSGADCVGRPQPLDVANASPWQRAIAVARSSWLGHHPSSFIYSSGEGFVRPQSVAVAYRRSVFDAVGLFDESFDACEDVEFNHRVDRAGLRCFFTPQVAVRYHPRASLLGLYRQMVRYGRGRVRLLRKHPDTFSLAAFVPALFLLGLAAGPVLAWWSAPLACLYAAALAAYAVLVGSVSLWLAARQRDVGLLPCLPAVFSTLHVGAGSGICWELAAGWLPRAKRWRVRHQESEGSRHAA
jgi:succinoglycan biosynthesis protein ExoA